MIESDYMSPRMRERIGYYTQRFYTLLGSRYRFYWMVKFSWWLTGDYPFYLDLDFDQ